MPAAKSSTTNASKISADVTSETTSRSGGWGGRKPRCNPTCYVGYKAYHKALKHCPGYKPLVKKCVLRHEKCKYKHGHGWGGGKKCYFVYKHGYSCVCRPYYYKPSHPSPSHPTPSHPTPSHPTPSHPTPSHPTPSHPTPPHPNPSHPTPPSHHLTKACGYKYQAHGSKTATYYIELGKKSGFFHLNYHVFKYAVKINVYYGHEVIYTSHADGYYGKGVLKIKYGGAYSVVKVVVVTTKSYGADWTLLGTCPHDSDW